MRIIAGSFRNREICVPNSLPVRPTSARLRGQVFNICQGCLEGAHALDLFAGSGAMGIEALSRGADRCVFVEQDHQVVETLKKNLRELGLQDTTKILEMDVMKSISALRSASPPFSFVYIDPPYRLTEPLNSLLEQIDETLPLEEGANLFLETRRGSFTPSHLSHLSLLSHRASGDSDLWHFSKAVR